MLKRLKKAHYICREQELLAKINIAKYLFHLLSLFYCVLVTKRYYSHKQDVLFFFFFLLKHTKQERYSKKPKYFTVSSVCSWKLSVLLHMTLAFCHLFFFVLVTLNTCLLVTAVAVCVVMLHIIFQLA